MMHRELIQIARDLASRDFAGPPKQVSLAKSVSSAYYAIFHALAGFCARETIGHRFWAEFKIVYRSLDHGRTKSAFEEMIKQPAMSDDLKIIGRSFITLQQERHRADYDIGYRSSRSAVRDLIDRAEEALDLIDRLDLENRKQLTARLVGGRSRKS